MDKKLEEHLGSNKVSYKLHEHPAVFTVAESRKIIMKKDYFHTKSLFLRDDKNNYYLVCMPADKRLDISFLRKHLNLEKLYFASPVELKQELNLSPGSVSIFGMINAKNTILIVDKDVWDAKSVGFHPNINTATLELSHKSLENFYNSLNLKKEIINLE